MIAKDFIQYEIPVLKPSDSVQKAFDYFSEFHVNQLLVCEKKKYLGIIEENQVLNLLDSDAKIKDLQLFHSEDYVDDKKHAIEIIRVATGADLHIVAVLDDEQNYLGSILVNDIVAAFTRLEAFRSVGGIVVLEMEQTNYIFNAIARIIESEGAKILCSYIHNMENDPGKLKVTIKVDLKDITSIIAALQRHNFKVIEYFHESHIPDTEKERLEGLFRFLNS